MHDWLSQLRDLIHETIPDVIEAIKWGRPVFSKMHNICYLDSNMDKGYVMLGFYNGAALPDPDGLLKGAGENLRHFKINSEKDLNTDAITNWLQHAAKTD